MEFRRGCGSKVERVTVKETHPYENRPYIKDAHYLASSSTRPYIVEPRREPGRRDSFPPGHRSDSGERGYYADSSFTSPKIYDAEPRYSSTSHLRQDIRSPSPEIRSHARSRPPPSRSAYSHSESYYDTKSQSPSHSDSKSYARSNRPSDSISPPPARIRRSTTSKHCVTSPPSPLPSRARHSDSHYQRQDSPPSPHLRGASPPHSTFYSSNYKLSRSSKLNRPPQPDSRSKSSKSTRGPPPAPTPPPAPSIPRCSTTHYETHNVSRSPSPKTKPQPPPKKNPEGHAGAPKFDYKLPANAIYTEWPVGGYTLPQCRE